MVTLPDRISAGICGGVTSSSAGGCDDYDSSARGCRDHCTHVLSCFNSGVPRGAEPAHEPALVRAGWPQHPLATLCSTVGVWGVRWRAITHHVILIALDDLRVRRAALLPALLCVSPRAAGAAHLLPRIGGVWNDESELEEPLCVRRASAPAPMQRAGCGDAPSMHWPWSMIF